MLCVRLDAAAVDQVRAVDLTWLSLELRAVDVRSTAVAGVLTRLAEIAELGMITGRAWPRIHSF
ncbi:hypothetical protein [Nocardia brasiliensis]|uniref:hypothetical protein n=1 Tax=Nocardia brasiliensis TaxID=37326 RepID=UPI003D8E3F7E